MRFWVKIRLYAKFGQNLHDTVLYIEQKPLFCIGCVVKSIRKQTPITDVCSLYAISRQIQG